MTAVCPDLRHTCQEEDPMFARRVGRRLRAVLSCALIFAAGGCSPENALLDRHASTGEASGTKTDLETLTAQLIEATVRFEQSDDADRAGIEATLLDIAQRRRELLSTAMND